MERSINFPATSIKNDIVINYIAAIEEIDEHEVILYSSADKTIENYKNDGREATKNICAGAEGEMVELSSDIHIGETLLTNYNNDNGELEARKNI